MLKCCSRLFNSVFFSSHSNLNLTNTIFLLRFVMWFFICNTYLTTLHFEIQLDAFASNRYATFFSRLHLRGFFYVFLSSE